MSEHAGPDPHAAPGGTDEMDHGLPRLAEIKPASKFFLYTILASLPFFIVGLFVITDPAQGTIFDKAPNTSYWLPGLLLIMLAAGILMSAAVYHSAVVHEEDSGH
jgi:NADH:ubiquinone oxidoreductase subunit 4 (subunit M)